MTCIDCCYSLLKDGNIICTYEEGNCIITDRMKRLEDVNLKLKAQIEKMRNFQNCDYQLHITDCPVFRSGEHMGCKKCPYWILQEVSE